MEQIHTTSKELKAEKSFVSLCCAGPRRPSGLNKTKSPKLSSSPQPSLGEQTEHLSEASADSGDAMFEGEASMPFIRGSRTRASLPVVRSTNQTKERSLGVLFLQYGEDTKKLLMPNEITGIDTIRALFVSAFPQQLTMKVLESPSTAIYIKDEGRNIYYELSDVRNIQDRSFLKVYNKDPAHVFNHNSRTVNGDVRMQRDITYQVREGPVVHRPGSATYSSHAGPISPPPTPVAHSMPPSPSRIPYGGNRPGMVQSNTTMPRERISSLPVSRSISPSPSAILERRDVKPDEDMGNKNVQLLRNDGMYAEPYLYHEGRMSVASSHGGHPLDVPDHVVTYHRAAMRSASTYSNSSMQMEMMEQSMYRQKSRKHSETHLPTLGTKTPPASPHRVTDVRMMDIHAHSPHAPPHAIQTDRASPLRQSFKKDQGPGMFVEAKVRNTGGILGMADVIPSPTDKQVFASYGVPPAPKDTYTRERMHAMEKQIASLTGLVQTALFKGPSPNNSKDVPSEKVLKSSHGATTTDSAGAHMASSGKNSLSIVESMTVVSHTPPVGSTDMHVSLHDMRRNVAELRLQLHKMRQIQLQNQELVRLMMKKTEMEISSKVSEIIKSLEDPVQRQRVLVEQERQKYLLDEEQIVTKLCELEGFVEELKKDSACNKTVTLKDVEDRAFLLRQVGEAVSNLKGEFPCLQNKMRAVLRVEVEAVRFLKEEPHKLDSLLKRIRNMTDALSSLRRHVSDGPSKATELNQNTQYIVTETDVHQCQEEKKQSYLQPTQTESAESPTSSVKSEVVPLSAGVKVHQVQSSPVLMQQSQHSLALVNHPANPQNSHTADLLGDHHSANTQVTVTQGSSGGIQQAPASQSAQHNGSSMQSLFIEEIHHASSRNRALSIEEAEKKFEEKRQNLDHYNGKEFEKMLEEAQANIMKSIPSLEMSSQSVKMDTIEKLEVTEGLEHEQENDKVMKSPPPPPPRRIYPPGSGISNVWTAETSYIVRRENSKDSDEVFPIQQSKVTKTETEEESQNLLMSAVKHPVIKDNDEEEEEEGERIMAELQAFQKCSFVETNSKSPNEHSKADTQDKDLRPTVLVLPKEKKVSCSLLNSESPKPVESTENKWKIQNATTDSPKDRDEDRHIVNEKSNYSLLLGREEQNKIYSKAMKKIQVEIPLEKDKVTILDNYGEKEKRDLVSNILRRTDKRVVESKKEAVSSTLLSASSVGKMSEVLEIQGSSTVSKSAQEQDVPYMDVGQTVVLRPKIPKKPIIPHTEGLDSPTRSPSEPKSPADKIAFIITKTEVQALSTGEVQDLVSRKGGEVHTVNIDGENVEQSLSGNTESVGSEDPVSSDKKPVIIIFDEPMDIKSAYKRLSTIFEECDDDLDKVMSKAKIVEEEEEEDSDMPTSPKQRLQITNTSTVSHSENLESENKYRFNYPSLAEMKRSIFDDGSNEEKSDAADFQFSQRQDAKKKFKFKFPKKQLAALTQAIRTGTKTGKKTLQVVVYEEEEEPDGTVKQHKEAKRFEIARTKSKEENAKSFYEKHTQLEELSFDPSGQVSRTDEIRKNTYRTLDSLEQTIKQLESTISGMTPKSDTLEGREEVGTSPDVFSISKEPIIVEENKLVLESPSSIPTSTRKGSNGASQTSRMPIPMSSKSRQGNMEKSSKQPKLQEPQRQYRQANGGTKKAGGDFKAASPTLSASKIPGLSSNTVKSSSMSSQCSDTSNSPNLPVKSHVTTTNTNTQTSRTFNSPSLIRPVHNGSSKLQSPAYTGKGHHLSFSLQTSNGRPSPPTASSSTASSPPASVSPTSLTQGMKSVRTIHTPSFTSYKSQNGSASKAPAPKETS